MSHMDKIERTVIKNMLLLRRFERFKAWSRIYFLEDGGFYFLQTHPPRPVFKRHSHTRMKMAAIIY